MNDKNKFYDYGIVEKLLHWSIAILVLGMLAFGFLLDDFPKAIKHQVVNMHKLVGIIVLFLMVFRLVWRVTHKQPSLPDSIPLWQQKLSHLIHGLLYVGVLVMPLAGWIMSSAKPGKAPHIAGMVLRLPVPANLDVAHFFWQVHSIGAWVLMSFISLHILAALKHALINRDGVFSRMWFS